MHEQIENEYIIGLLQQRCTVHNVHSDNKLSDMLSLFEKGLHNIKVIFDLFILVFAPGMTCITCHLEMPTNNRSVSVIRLSGKMGYLKFTGKPRMKKL